MARPVLLSSWAAGLALFAYLGVPAYRGEVPGFDRAVFEWLQELRTPFGDLALSVCTLCGGGRLLVPLSLLAVFVVARRNPRRGLLFLAYALGVVALEVAGKRIVGRPRPLIAPEDVTGFSDLGFPSGHALASTALYGMLALVLSTQASSARSRIAILGLGVLLALTVAASRVYYAAHWPSDALGGFVLGLTYLSVVWATGVFDPRRAP